MDQNKSTAKQEISQITVKNSVIIAFDQMKIFKLPAGNIGSSNNVLLFKQSWRSELKSCP